MENFTPEGAAPLHASEKSLAHQVQGDVASAVLSALPAAAFVSIIDQAVTQNASKSATLLNSMKQSLKTMFTRPHRFFTGPAYLAVAGVYTFTYVAANLTMTWCERTDRKPDMYVSLGPCLPLPCRAAWCCCWWWWWWRWWKVSFRGLYQ